MPEGILFHALITPHRSLSPRGLAGVVGIIMAGTAVTALRFVFVGAWPVLPFGIVESGLAIWLLLRHARRTRASELVILTDSALLITRTDDAGRQSRKELANAWLSVVVEDRPGSVCRLLLCSHGEREEIGTVLGDGQKRDLAKALEGALWRKRNPVFDNPQLRE